MSALVFARKLEERKSGYKVERSGFYCRHHCSLLQLARCEERLGLVEQSLSSTQDQLSGRVSEVRYSDQLLLLLLLPFFKRRLAFDGFPRKLFCIS